METTGRSLAKAISYRILGSLVTALIFLFLSHDVKLSAGAGLLDAVLKMGGYFLHERLWDRIPFGRQPQPPEYEI